MSEILEYNPGDVEISMFLEEGNLTVERDSIQDSGTGVAYNFTQRIRKGDFVKLVASGDKTVELIDDNDLEVIGQVLDHPQWSGNKPELSANSGTYPKRIATIRVFGSGIYSVPLEANNNLVLTAGDSVVPADNQYFTKSTGVNNTRVLQSRNTGKVAVVFGYYGDLTPINTEGG